MIYLKKHISKVFLSIVPIFLISITVASMTNKGTNSEKITIAEATVTTVSAVQTNYTETETAEQTDSPVEEYRYNAEIPLSRFLQITMQNACREYGVPYTGLHGQDKYNKVVESVSEMLAEKGITITDIELKMLIEAAVGEFNKVFNNDTESITE